MAFLKILKGPNPGKMVLLEGAAKLLLGRHAASDLVINDPAVSREHAQVVAAQGKFYIEDLKSRNKTYVNGQPLSARRLLIDGDRIKICDFVCAFYEGPDRGATVGEEEESSSTVEFSLDQHSQPPNEAQSPEVLAFLLDLASRLVQKFQLDLLLPEILDSLFGWYRQADRGFIIFRDEDAGQLVMRAVRTREPQDGSNPRFSRRIVNQCLESGHALLSKDAARDPQFGSSDSIATTRIRSVMCVPLLTRNTNRPFGVIQLDTQDYSKRFTAEDLRLLGAVAIQAAAGLDNARLYQEARLHEQNEHDMALARQVVQCSILPEQLPVMPGYQFFAHYASAMEVGGDYYDFIALADQRLAVTIGDVAGKGMPAALLMAKLASDARSCLLAQPDLAAAVALLNNLIHRASFQADRFVTLAAAVLHPERQTVTLVNAGHPVPLVYRAATQTLHEAMPRELAGVPIGIEKDSAYRAWTVDFGRGDCLVLFTDGVTEARDRRNVQFRMPRVYEVLRSGPATPPAMGERLVAAVKQYSLGCKQHDDITVVCFGRTA
jgi:serine phosphatase RsbU (regulator of sigma subunit)